jgi:hypothetical protein
MKPYARPAARPNMRPSTQLPARPPTRRSATEPGTAMPPEKTRESKDQPEAEPSVGSMRGTRDGIGQLPPGQIPAVAGFDDARETSATATLCPVNIADGHGIDSPRQTDHQRAGQRSRQGLVWACTQAHRQGRQPFGPASFHRGRPLPFSAGSTSASFGSTSIEDPDRHDITVTIATPPERTQTVLCPLPCASEPAWLLNEIRWLAAGAGVRLLGDFVANDRDRMIGRDLPAKARELARTGSS